MDGINFAQLKQVSILIETLNTFDNSLNNIIEKENFQNFDVEKVLTEYLKIKLDEEKFIKEFLNFNKEKETKESKKQLFNDFDEFGEVTKINPKLQQELSEEYNNKIYDMEKMKFKKKLKSIKMKEITLFKEKSKNELLLEDLRNLFEFLPATDKVTDEIELIFQEEIETIIQKYGIKRSSIEIQLQKIEGRIREIKKNKYRYSIDLLKKTAKEEIDQNEKLKIELEQLKNEEMKFRKIYEPTIVEEELIQKHMFDFSVVFESYINYLNHLKLQRVKKLQRVRKFLVKKIKKFNDEVLQFHDKFTKNKSSEMLFDYLKIPNYQKIVQNFLDQVIKEKLKFQFKQDCDLLNEYYEITTFEKFLQSIGNYYDFYLRIKEEGENFEKMKNILEKKTIKKERNAKEENHILRSNLVDYIKAEVESLNQQDVFDSMEEEIEIGINGIPWIKSNEDNVYEEKITSFKLLQQYDEQNNFKKI
eukprot:gene620-8124_t